MVTGLSPSRSPSPSWIYSAFMPQSICSTILAPKLSTTQLQPASSSLMCPQSSLMGLQSPMQTCYTPFVPTPAGRMSASSQTPVSSGLPVTPEIFQPWSTVKCMTHAPPPLPTPSLSPWLISLGLTAALKHGSSIELPLFAPPAAGGVT
ncbi:hypothetical protein AX15_004563 [Amanita polypyramis BW_CC]|nr:hypothetical protein AX15_004563 [Amanita polypyramis BW_CC]